MTKSDSIAQLADALSKAQAEMSDAKKDSANPFFKSSYADLASVWDACRQPLGKYGLSVSQLPESSDGKITIHTILMHSSGEWIASELSMTPVKNDPQGMGSAITYARRYALAAAVGIAPADDDGNAASNKTVERTTAPISIPKVAAPAIKQAAVPQAIKGVGLQQAATVTEQLKASLEAIQQRNEQDANVQRQPGDDDDTEECIDLPRQKALHREFREAIKNEDAKKAADVWLRTYLEKQGYIDREGKGTTKTIPMVLFEETKADAIKFAAGLPQ